MEGKELTKRKEIDLEIRDFVWEILRNWRLLIICMLAGALLLGGYQYASDLKAARTTPEETTVQQQQTLEEMESALGAQDMDEVLGAVALKKQLDEKSAYASQSLLMQINPYEESVVYLHYYIMSENEDAAEMAEVYKNYVLHGEIASELIDIATESDAMYLTSDNDTVAFDIGSDEKENSFVVRVRGLSADECMEMAREVKNALNQYAMETTSQISAHELFLLQETSQTVVDQGLVKLQNQTALAIKQLNNSLDSVKSNMTGDQLALYKRYTEPQPNEKTESESASDEQNAAVAENVSVRISATKVLIGAIIGLVLAVLWCLLSFLFTAKLRSSEEIKTLYRVNVLGNVRSKVSGKRNAFDQWLLKRRYHHAAELSLEEELDLVSANIKVACQLSENKKVYLTGSAMAQIPEACVEKLTQECKERGIILVKGREICYHASALEELAETGQVVFIETIRASFYEEMYKEVACCKEHEIPVLGMIVMGV